MQNFVHEMLHDSPPAKRMMDLWQVIDSLIFRQRFSTEESDLTKQEYEEGQTDEAKFVKGICWISQVRGPIANTILRSRPFRNGFPRCVFRFSHDTDSLH